MQVLNDIIFHRFTMGFSHLFLQEKSFSAIIEKPISDLNSTDINQLVSIVGGGAKRVNYTTSSLNQLTTLVEYFSKNETGVSQLVDNADMNVS